MEELAATPHVLDALVEQGFRAVAVEAGDCTGVAISDKGELRIWGTFRVSYTALKLPTYTHTHTFIVSRGKERIFVH
jgi:hypothetical protein